MVGVKWGKGSFIKTADDAKQLARSLTRVGRTLKRRCVALVTDVNQPLGSCVGASLEIKEAIELLGEECGGFTDLVMKLGMEIVRLAGVAGSTLSSQADRPQTLGGWNGLGKIQGNSRVPRGRQQGDRQSPKSFRLPSIRKSCPLPNVDMFTRSMRVNSPGRTDTGSWRWKEIRPCLGVAELCKVGTQMKQGEPLDDHTLQRREAPLNV